MFVALITTLLTISSLGVAQGLNDCMKPRYSLYLGYYREDPTNNPEDPTAGMILGCFPSKSGNFRTQFLFSYVGCMGYINLGSVRGYKRITSMEGDWRGSVDGKSIGGSFEGSCNDEMSYCSGNWYNSGGKTRVQVGGCRYFVSPVGSWYLFRLGEGSGNFKPNIDTSKVPPVIRWGSVPGSGYYFVYVHDKDCLYRKMSLHECTVWHASCPQGVTSVPYGDRTICIGITPALPLESGKEYVVSVMATGGSMGGMIPGSDVKAFGMEVFRAP